MASAAVLWFGEDMSAVPLRNNKAAAGTVRAVTVLGATGSIGDSTMDLLRAPPDRYRVEALTANRKRRVSFRPADSEHNALFQALGSGNREELVRVIITASGGPFRTWAAADIEQATLAQALKHPNWSMGQKITIDSASMMNKGLEVIEASYLFALDADEIDVLVHPQSIVHGMVEFSDRSVVAQLGAPDMRTPIAHCLGWPDRISVPAAKVDLAKIGQLTFEAPDFERFPALRLAYESLRTGGGATTVYNAANEVAVAAFIAGRNKFGAIARLVEATLEDWTRSGNLAPLTSADDAIAVDHNARNTAATLLPQIALKAS